MTAHEEVGRAYDTVLGLLVAGDVQHLHPYQLQFRTQRLRDEHLARLDEDEPSAGSDPVPQRTPYEDGRLAAALERPRADNPHDGRTSQGKEWARGWDDESNAAQAAEVADGGPA